MALSISETPEAIELRDENGRVVQTIPRGSLPPSVENQYRQYPEYQKPGAAENAGQAVGGAISAMGLGAKTLGEIGSGIASRVASGVGDFSRGVGVSLGLREPATTERGNLYSQSKGLSGSQSPGNPGLSVDPSNQTPPQGQLPTYASAMGLNRSQEESTMVPQTAYGGGGMGGYGRLYSDIRKGADIEAQAKQQMANTETAAIQERKDAEQRQDQNLVNRAEFVQQRARAADDALAALEQFDFKPEEKGVIRGRSTGEKIGRSFGIAIGLLASPITKNNPVYDYFNRELLREKQEEMRNFEKIKRGVDVSNTRLSLARQHVNDMGTVDAILDANYWARKQREVQNIANQYESPKVKQNAEIMISQLEAKRQDAIRSAQAEIMKEAIKAETARQDVKPLAAESSGKFAMAYTAYLDAQKQDLGGVDWNALGSSPKEQARKRREQAVLRLATGAAYTKPEIKDTLIQYVPKMTDSPQEVQAKNEAFNSWAIGLLSVMDPTGRYREIISRNLPEKSLPRSGASRSISQGQEPSNVDRLFQPKR